MNKSTSKRVATAQPGLPHEIVTAVHAAADRKAVDLVVLDLREAHGFTDYFVIATGNNARQVQAIAEAVEDALRETGARPAHTEGYGKTEWILLDYFDFVVHVFSPSTRAFYGLERLWGNASSVDLTTLVAPPAAPRR